MGFHGFASLGLFGIIWHGFAIIGMVFIVYHGFVLFSIVRHSFESETFHDCQETPENENFVFAIFLQKPLRTT